MSIIVTAALPSDGIVPGAVDGGQCGDEPAESELGGDDLAVDWLEILVRKICTRLSVNRHKPAPPPPPLAPMAPK